MQIMVRVTVQGVRTNINNTVVGQWSPINSQQGATATHNSQQQHKPRVELHKPEPTGMNHKREDITPENKESTVAILRKNQARTYPKLIWGTRIFKKRLEVVSLIIIAISYTKHLNATRRKAKVMLT